MREGFCEVYREKSFPFFCGIDIVQYKIKAAHKGEVLPFFFPDILDIYFQFVVELIGKIAEAIAVVMRFTAYDAFPHQVSPVDILFNHYLRGVFTTFKVVGDIDYVVFGLLDEGGIDEELKVTIAHVGNFQGICRPLVKMKYERA